MVITARLQKRPQLRAVVTKPQSGGGYSEGYEAGKEAGYQDGYKAGHTDGYNTGHSMGYAEGWDAGYARGYDEGYAKGKADVEAQNEAILSDINTVLVEKGAERAESLTDVPEKIGSIQAGGGDSYHDIFWDSFQRNGAETDYQYKFRGAGWTDANFKPKYDIVPEGNATSIFESSGITDVKGILEALGITLDFSKVTYANNPYSGSAITRLPVLDLSNIENLSSHFNSASKLVWIDEVVLSESGNHNFGSGTGYNWTLYSNIKHMPIRGKIGRNAYFNSLGDLDDVTVQSIFDSLIDLTGQTAQTVYFHKTVGNKLTDAQKASASAKNWTVSY